MQTMGYDVSLLQVKMPPMMEIITAEQLMEYLGERFVIKHMTQEQVDATSLTKGEKPNNDYIKP